MSERLYRYQIGSSGYWVECEAKEALVVYPDGREEPYRGIDIGETPKPQPRPVVAISDDRQWLVVLGIPYRNLWGVYLFDGAGAGSDFITEIEDTGQSADEVLASFLAERS